MQTNPAIEQSKIVRWSESPWNQSGIGKEKVYEGKDWISVGFRCNSILTCRDTFNTAAVNTIAYEQMLSERNIFKNTTFYVRKSSPLYV